mmetsp:Transcript_63949/g.101422  ORF Transcript_63949/g.101422 Transcript_63949/m.101422 type:complete len:137 (-) Transcript_63949:156-566(-)
MEQRLQCSKAMMFLGSGLCGFSLKMTFVHALSPSFEAPTYKKGAKHTRYHAFRGGTLALGSVAALNMVVNARDVDRSPTLWNVAAVIALGYFGGWWAPKPYLGLKTPSWMAEFIHIGAASLCCGALLLARPAFFKQ